MYEKIIIKIEKEHPKEKVKNMLKNARNSIRAWFLSNCSPQDVPCAKLGVPYHDIEIAITRMKIT